MAQLVGIFISPDKGLPMKSVRSVMAHERLGLEGDRYFSQKGSWMGKDETEHKKKRNITLIGCSDIIEANRKQPVGAHFNPTETRRNLLINAMNVLELIGREFEIGHARFLGIEHATPCDRPSRLCNKPGFEQAFEGRGGLNAAVLLSGVISVEDELIVSSRWF